MQSRLLASVGRRGLAAGAAVILSTTLLASAATVTNVTAATSPPSPPPPPPPPGGMVPPAVAVTVNPATTAYLLLDLNTTVCQPLPSCVATLPADASLLSRARQAGAKVIYTNTFNPGSQILTQVAPQAGEPVVTAHDDKFYNTTLQSILQQDGVNTLVIVGTVANGAVLYTTLEANLRGFTVAVAEDGVSASTAYEQQYSLFQVLNEPGFSNVTNTALKSDSVTLTRTTLVTFQ